jgi:hypothetical protein
MWPPRIENKMAYTLLYKIFEKFSARKALSSPGGGVDIARGGFVGWIDIIDYMHLQKP